jgi:hypothetical protein
MMALATHSLWAEGLMRRYLLALSLVALLPSLAHAECKAPLPANIVIDPAPSSIPQAAAFLGRWEGIFQSSAVQFCERMAIQHIAADGTVTLTLASEDFYFPARGGNPPVAVKAQSADLVGHLRQEGLTFTGSTGNQWLFKADGTASVQLRGGGIATARFTKQ